MDRKYSLRKELRRETHTMDIQSFLGVVLNPAKLLKRLSEEKFARNMV